MRILPNSTRVQERTIISRFSSVLLLTAACSSWLQTARANIIYNEAASGDLSNSGSTPTVLTVGAGENDVFGTTGRGDNGLDRDYFTFTVPAGFALTAIVVLPGTVTAGDVSFIGVEAGSQVTLPSNASTAAGLLGWQHYTANSGNILPDMSIPFQGSSGFTPPLGPGSYAFWVQELSRGSYAYGFNFRLEAVSASVPETGPGLLSCATVFGLLLGFGQRAVRRAVGAS